MTIATTTSIGRLARTLAICAISAGAALGLAACQSSGLSDGALSSAAPASVAPAGKAKLAFAPIVGAPAAVSDMLLASVSSAVERQSIPVSHSAADVPDYTVRGYLVAAPDKAGSKISYIWDITDKTGQRAKRITGEEIVKLAKKSKDPWAGVDQAVVDKITQDTSTQIANWSPMNGGAAPNPPGTGPSAQAAPASTSSSFGGSFGSIFGLGGSGDQTASATPAPASATPSAPAQTASLAPQQQPPSLVTGAGQAPAATIAALPAAGDGSTAIPAVIGAPGDGANSLTAALQRSLSASGVKLASAGVSGVYTVQGKVTMGAPAGGKQSIKIEWIVYDPAGKKVGTVSQNNVVPQGSLDGPWGKTADLAAQAAAQGVLKLLPHQTASSN